MTAVSADGSLTVPPSCLWVALNMDNAGWTERRITTRPAESSCCRRLSMFSTCQVVRCYGDDMSLLPVTFYSSHVTVCCLHRHLLTKLACFFCSNHLMEIHLILFSVLRLIGQKDSLHIEMGSRPLPNLPLSNVFPSPVGQLTSKRSSRGESCSPHSYLSYTSLPVFVTALTFWF